jgi:tungstate transport system substrate-binding protein
MTWTRPGPVLLAVVAAAAVLAACGGGSPAADGRIGGSMILATTTSLQDSGLLDVLVPLFEERTGIDVKVIAVGTGAALEMAARGDADALLVHAPASEQQYIDAGDLVGGRLVMHNAFVIVGPPDDPAGVRDAANLADALAAIAAAGAFISRGDGSGTHQKELEIFAAAGIPPDAVRRREETGQGMGATLNIADQRRAYTLTDRGTYLSLRRTLDLVVVFEGDRSLLNPYTAYVVNPGKHAKVKKAQAEAFVAFMAAGDAQALIGSFGTDRYGEALFVPDAGTSAGALAR